MIVLEWKESAGADECQEFLRIDVNHLTKKAVSKIECSKVRLPNGDECTWRVKCSLEEHDDDHRIIVRYSMDEQVGWLLRWLRRSKHRGVYTGKTIIFVRVSPKSGKAKKSGRFEWHSVAKSPTLKGKWRTL